MEFKSLGQIIACVFHARQWFKQIGVSTDGTRLEESERYLHELLNPTDPEARSFSDNPDGAEAYHALTDAAIFGHIARGLSAIPSHKLPRGALRDALRGSIALSAESAGESSDPRNKSVELELAAHCAMTGLDVVGFDDLRLDFEECHYVIECKRPSRRSTLDENVEKAYTQLQSRLREGDRGLVAVAVDKVLDLDGRFHPADTLEDFSTLGRTAAVAFRELVSKYEHAWIDPRVVGIVAIVRFLAKSRHSELVAYSYQLAIIKFASEHRGQPVDSLRLDRLAEALRTQY